jgi:hypothetical protein
VTDDLTTRLREASTEDRAEVDALMREAAARIEALEASLAGAKGAIRDQISATKIRENERDAALAVIAEALAWFNKSTREYDSPLERKVRDILSRVPQGAAEPSDESLDCGALGEDGRGYTERCELPKGHEGKHDWWNMPEPWTDPKPWVNTDGHRFADRSTARDWAPFWRHDPRSREQYDAEEGNR